MNKARPSAAGTREGQAGKGDSGYIGAEGIGIMSGWRVSYAGRSGACGLARGRSGTSDRLGEGSREGGGPAEGEEEEVGSVGREWGAGGRKTNEEQKRNETDV